MILKRVSCPPVIHHQVLSTYFLFHKAIKSYIYKKIYKNVFFWWYLCTYNLLTWDWIVREYLRGQETNNIDFYYFLFHKLLWLFQRLFSEIKMLKSHANKLPFRNISHNFYPVDVFHISIVASNGCSNYLVIQTEKDVTFLLLLTRSLLLPHLSTWHCSYVYP